MLKRLMTPMEVALILRIPPERVLDLVSRGILAGVWVGDEVRFDPVLLQVWIDRCGARRPPDSRSLS